MIDSLLCIIFAACGPRKLSTLTALVTWATASTVFAASPDATLTIQAKLFQHDSGTFSKDVLLPGGPPLGNVVAGEGASNSTFVTVLVALPQGVVLPSDSRVRLVVRAGKYRTLATTVLLDRTEPLGAVARGGRIHIGFWLPKTGCRPLQLNASLSVARQAITLSKTAEIPFTCGE